MSRHGGKLLVDQLVVHGADTIFSVPGESFLAVLDGLYDSPIRLITCRHEAGAANMADAYGKLTGRPGIAIVTRGPGATQASVGVHTAFQDSTPMILLVGQVASDQVEREAFQEIDFRRMFGPMTKWVAQIDRPTASPSTSRARSRRRAPAVPAPVVLALPGGHADERDRRGRRGAVPRRAAASGRGADRAAPRLLERAERPFAIVGGGGWTPRAARGHAHVPRGERDSRRRRVPPAGRDRQRLAELCRRRRHRHQPEARRARPRVRPAARGRPAARRDDDVRLHAHRRLHPAAARARHPGAEELGRVYRPTCRSSRGWSSSRAAVRDLRVEPAGATGRRLRAPTTRPGSSRADAGHARPRRVHRPSTRARAGRDRDQRRRQLLGVGPSLLALARLSVSARTDERGDGLRRPCRVAAKLCARSGP